MAQPPTCSTTIQPWAQMHPPNTVAYKACLPKPCLLERRGMKGVENCKGIPEISNFSTKHTDPAHTWASSHSETDGTGETVDTSNLSR